MSRFSFPVPLSLILFTVLAASFSCSRGRGSEDLFAAGKVYPSVSCLSDTLVRYALCLPPSYNGKQKYPVLICFDPHADGLIPVELFREAAGRQGVILAGSLDSKNGMPFEQSAAFFNTILDDLREKFSIQDSAVYLAGFSGGARVAGGIAFTQENIAGVLAFGAGLPQLNRPPVKPFSYFAMAGNRDFNYLELVSQDEMLENTGFRHHLSVFEGKHEWPPKPCADEIFTWMVFDRMRNGSLSTDRQKVDRFIDTVYGSAESYRVKNEPYLQLKELLTLRDYLKGLTNTAPLDEEIAKLMHDPRIRAEQEKEKKLSETERSLQERYRPLLTTKGIEFWQDECSGLHGLAGNAPSKEEQALYERVLGFLSLSCYMLAEQAIRQDLSDDASGFVEIYRLIDPGNAEHRYMAALIAMKQGRPDEALARLEEAFKLGFPDKSRLKADPAFTALRDNPEFRALAGIP